MIFYARERANAAAILLFFLVLRRTCTSRWIPNARGHVLKSERIRGATRLQRRWGIVRITSATRARCRPCEPHAARETHGRALHRLSHMLGLSHHQQSARGRRYADQINKRRAARGLEAQRPAPVASIRSRQRRRRPLHLFFDGEQPGVRWLVQAAMGAQHESAHAG